MSRDYLLETYIQFKFKTNKLEATAMAGVVEQSRRPQSRHTGEPRLEHPRLEGLAPREKVQKTPRITQSKGGCTPSLLRPEVPGCSASLRAGPGESPQPSVTPVSLAHSPGSTSPGSWVCSGASSWTRSPSCCPQQTWLWGWVTPGRSPYQMGWRREQKVKVS